MSSLGDVRLKIIEGNEDTRDLAKAYYMHFSQQNKAIEAKARWPIFCGGHFQMHFL